MRPEVYTLNEIVDNSLSSILVRSFQRMLSKLTFTLTGLRVDVGSVVVGSGVITTVSNVTTVAAANNVALGKYTADAVSVQDTRLNFQSGFRRNLTVT